MRVKSNKIKDIVSYAYDELKSTYDKEEIKSLVFILFQQFANLNSAFVLAFQEKTINESELLNIVLAIKDLKHNKPIQQIIGKVDFLNHFFVY
jgi:methylase of polypeptide subunit release factors